jgi:hypothetical protein
VTETKSKLRQKERLATAIAEAFVRVDSNFDFQDLGEKLQKLLQETYPPPTDGNGQYPIGWNEVTEITLDHLVYECNGESWRVEFTLDAKSGDPILGNRTRVEAVYVPVAEGVTGKTKLSEAFEGRLAQSKEDATGWVWDLQIFKEGPTKAAQVDGSKYTDDNPILAGKKMRTHYTAESCQQAVTERMFELAPFILRDIKEHSSFQKGGSRTYAVNEEAAKMAGSIDQTYVAESIDNDGKLATFGKLRIKNSESGRALRKFFLDRVAEGQDIIYEASWTGGVDYEIVNPSASEPILKVTRISEVMSVDPVFRGNAGGKVFRLAESLQTTMKEADRIRLAMKYGTAQAKSPKVAKLAEAEEEAGGADVDIETKVAGAFLKANPAIAGIIKTPEEVLKNPDAVTAMNKWLDDVIAGAGGSTTEPTDDEDPALIAEGLRGKPKKKAALAEGADLVDRMSKLEEALLKSQETSKALLAESFMKDNLKGMPENLQNYVRNVAKIGNIQDTVKLGELIQDTKKNMLAEGAVKLSMDTMTPDQKDKQFACLINLIGRGQQTRPEVKKAIAESLGYDPFKRDYDGLYSIKEMLRSYDGIDVHKAGGFGIDARGKMSEAYDPGISVQLAYDAMYLFLQAEWDQPDEIYSAWRKITGTTSAQDFRNTNTDNFGYFKADDITERTDQTADYTELTLSGAENAPYKIKDYAFLFSIYWVDFVNDNVGKFQRLPSEMANVFERKVYNATMDLIWNAPFQVWTGATEDNGTTMVPVTAKMVDSHWGNAPGTPGALAYAQLISNYMKLFSATQLGSDAITAARPKYLLTMLKDWEAGYKLTMPTDQTAVAASTTTGLGILAAKGLNTLTSASLPLEHIVVPRWDSKLDGSHSYSRWALVCDPARQPCLQVFNYVGIQRPILMQEATGSGKSFTADAIRYKEKYPHNVGLANPRGFLVDAAS